MVRKSQSEQTSKLWRAREQQTARAGGDHATFFFFGRRKNSDRKDKNSSPAMPKRDSQASELDESAQGRLHELEGELAATVDAIAKVERQLEVVDEELVQTKVLLKGGEEFDGAWEALPEFVRSQRHGNEKGSFYNTIVDDKKQLSKKEEQLRDKENQLRDKENRLAGEIAAQRGLVHEQANRPPSILHKPLNELDVVFSTANTAYSDNVYRLQFVQFPHCGRRERQREDPPLLRGGDGAGQGVRRPVRVRGLLGRTTHWEREVVGRC